MTWTSSITMASTPRLGQRMRRRGGRAKKFFLFVNMAVMFSNGESEANGVATKSSKLKKNF